MVDTREYNQKLFNTFDRLVFDFSEKNFPEERFNISTFHKGGDTNEPVTNKSADIYFKNFKLKFIYGNSTGMFMPGAGILECCVTFSKDSKGLVYSIYDLMYLLDYTNFKCYTFYYIENEDRLKQCFDFLSAFVLANIHKIQKISEDINMIKIVRAPIVKNIMRYTGKNIFEPGFDKDIKAYAIQDYYVFVRDQMFGDGAYLDFLSKNYDSSIKKFSKRKLITEYEARLQNFMKVNRNILSSKPYPAVSEELSTLRDGILYKGGGHNPFKKIGILFGSTVVFSLINLLFYDLFAAISYHNAIFTFGLSYLDKLFVIGPGLITAFAFYPLINSLLIPFANGINKERIKQYNQILDRERINRGFTRSAIVVCIIALLYTALLSNQGVSFYDVGIKDCQKFFSLSSDNIYLYSEVETCYIVEGYTNSLGKYVPFRFVVLKFKDDTKLSLDIYTETETYEFEEKVVPVLEDRGVNVSYIKDEKDID